MEIVSKSPTRPHSLLDLDNSLPQTPWETSYALLLSIRNTATNLNNEHRQLLLGCLKALHIQESLFRPVLKDFPQFRPRPKEEKIIQAAVNGLYPVNLIEGAFYKYGGLRGIVALILVFRETDSIRKQWAVIDIDVAQQWLASNISELFSSQSDWIARFFAQGTTPLFVKLTLFADRTDLIPGYPFPLSYLGSHTWKPKGGNLGVSKATSSQFKSLFPSLNTKNRKKNMILNGSAADNNHLHSTVQSKILQMTENYKGNRVASSSRTRLL